MFALRHDFFVEFEHKNFPFLSVLRQRYSD